MTLSDTVLTGGFWKDLYDRNAAVSVYAVQKQFEETGRFEALRFTHKEKPDSPLHVFFDSDVAKWMEAVGYLLQVDRTRYADLEAFCDALIDSMAKNQMGNGYLNSYFRQMEPENIFQNRNAHELYCIGHLCEAAIAYDAATGKHLFLEVIQRALENVRRVFIEEDSAAFATGGHEEIEIALLRMYEYTGEASYLDMAKHFLYRRGNNDKDSLLIGNVVNEYYAQDQCPAVDMTEADGHAVRALYYYTAMAGVARETGDAALAAACRRIWENVIHCKMYVTGGVGSTRVGECFATSYTLPNSTAYSESCAAIALVLFARRMGELDTDTGRRAEYADIIERVLYNGFLSSTSLDGKRFFYENPLEINLAERGTETSIFPQHRQQFPPNRRVEVFSCSCCPPNINRTMASVAQYAFAEDEARVYVEQFMSARMSSAGVEVVTDYPYGDSVTVTGKGYRHGEIALRIPSFCRDYTFDRPYREENGYAVFSVEADFTLTATYRQTPTFLYADSRVFGNIGRTALSRGPIIYALEGVDNRGTLTDLFVDTTADIEPAPGDFQPLPRLLARGARRHTVGGLYTAEPPEYRPELLTFIPYFTFANREASDMQVWVNVLR